MKIETKLKYKDGVYNIFVKKYMWIFPYWSLIYRTEVQDYAVKTLHNLAIISNRN